MDKFQHTATRRWLQGRSSFLRFDESFNTQPPEGGCRIQIVIPPVVDSFNTQPPEGGCKTIPFSS